MSSSSSRTPSGTIPRTGSATAGRARCTPSRYARTGTSPERVSGQLWTVVHSDVLRRAALGGQALQHADGPVSVDAALHQHRERLAGELVDHVQQPDHAPVGGLVLLVVQRPHLPQPLGPQPLDRHRRVTQPPALAFALGHPQALLAPQALHPLAVDLLTLLCQPLVRPPVPPPRTILQERPGLGAQRRVIRPPGRLVACVSDAAPPPGTPSAR